MIFSKDRWKIQYIWYLWYSRSILLIKFIIIKKFIGPLSKDYNNY